MRAFGSTFHSFSASPVRLARPRTPGFHPGDRGSNPLREAIFLSELRFLVSYVKPFVRKALLSVHSNFQTEHFEKIRLRPSPLFSRMVLSMLLPQASTFYTRIYLCRRNVTVSEQILDRAQISTPL